MTRNCAAKSVHLKGEDEAQLCSEICYLNCEYQDQHPQNTLVGDALFGRLPFVQGSCFVDSRWRFWFIGQLRQNGGHQAKMPNATIYLSLLVACRPFGSRVPLLLFSIPERLGQGTKVSLSSMPFNVCLILDMKV